MRFRLRSIPELLRRVNKYEKQGSMRVCVRIDLADARGPTPATPSLLHIQEFPT
jgi:hypothetical protein